MPNRTRGVATLKTVDRALRVLEIVAASPSPPSVRDVAERLGHNLSSTYHLVNTLVARGYLSGNGSDGLRVGGRIGTLYAALSQGSDLARLGRPILERLAGECGETVYLTHLIVDRVVIEIVIESAQSLRVTGLAVGYAGSEDRRASGRAVMAYLRPAELALVTEHALLGVSEQEKKARLADLMWALPTIREQGYAVDDQLFEVGIVGLGAPYFDANGDVLGAVTVTAPTVRAERLLGPVKDQILKAADDVSQALHAPSAVRIGTRSRN